MSKNLDLLTINTLRFLAVDAVQSANSGHPGLPLGAAPMAYVIWKKHLKHNPKNPNWYDRDRFVLSAGHGSALLYALIHLSGYDLSLNELRNFRQWDSKTPGHPEYGHTPGVETTTGPLGQGFANGVGMAMAERFLSKKYNRPNFNIIDHYVYGIVSDGDLMEGIASEAASIAGHLNLGKLIYLYDDNNITIDGSTDLAFTEDVFKRFESYNWHVQSVDDGNNIDLIDEAIKNAKRDDRPSLIKVKTIIGFGSPNEGTSSVHGSPLGEEGLKQAKKNLRWESNDKFYIPNEAKNNFSSIQDGKKNEDKWNKLFQEFGQKFPQLKNQFENSMRGVFPDDWKDLLPKFTQADGPIATRSASGKVLNSLSESIDNLFGGSADLEPSNNSYQKNKKVFNKENFDGNNIHYGVREHAMAAIANGMAVHGGVIPYIATFLIFSDYMKGAIRLSALMGIKVIYIFTHDSIGVGEDGPTHQPIEQTMSLRLIPGLTVIRPADANETANAWKTALENNGPTAILLTRQKLPIIDSDIVSHSDNGLNWIEKKENKTDLILLASGSEVSLAMNARNDLMKENISAQVISIPSWELFKKNNFGSENIPIITIEAGTTIGWSQFYSGREGKSIGIDRFGASAPGDIVMEKLGLSVKNVVLTAKKLLNK
tara:strand:- start:14588 stop:16552 length:1965 start_codon:yes stop_codon:yes gene_type:complete